MRIALIVMVVLVALFIVVRFQSFFGGLAATNRTGTYKRGKIMTANEQEFFGRLVAGLPEHFIFPQVAMTALLTASSPDKRVAHADRLRIAQQRVDFVVCSRHGDIVAVVELDDRTHVASKDVLRDERLACAGIRTVRFQSKNKPTAEMIRAMLATEVAANAGSVPASP